MAFLNTLYFIIVFNISKPQLRKFLPTLALISDTAHFNAIAASFESVIMNMSMWYPLYSINSTIFGSTNSPITHHLVTFRY